MKKTLIALAALSSMVYAATDITLSPLDAATGWSFGHNNASKSATPSLAEGAITYANGDWSRGYAVYDVAENITIDCPVHTMTVSMTITSSTANSCKTLALVGTDKTIVIGGGRWSNAIQMGETETADTYYQFQAAETGGTFVTVTETAPAAFHDNMPVTLSYDIAWDETASAFVATGKFGESSLGTINLGTSFTLDKVVISLDGGTDGGKAHSQTVSAMVVAAHLPEPATATLSLLALAGLAARRRRH